MIESENKILDGVLALAFCVAAVAGASGACLIVAHKVLRGRNISALLVGSYAVVGAVLAVAIIAYLFAFTAIRIGFPELVLYGVLAGAMGSAVLAATNLSARFILRRLGIEVEVRVKSLEKIAGGDE